MKHKSAVKSDKLSETLEGIALNIPVAVRNAEAALRPQLIQILNQWKFASIEAGRMLTEYREAYRATGDRNWTLALEAIANAMGCSLRTLTRLIERYREVSVLPKKVLIEMNEAGIDPMKSANGPIVDNILEMFLAETQPDSNHETTLIQTAKLLHANRTKERRNKEQNQQWRERLALRGVMERYPPAKKVGQVITALEQELFDVWGITEPIKITIVPHSGPFTLDGMLRAGIGEPQDESDTDVMEAA